MSRLFSLLFFLLLSPALCAEVRFASVLTDHLVLQRNRPIHLWGTADAGEKLSVRFCENTYKVKADEAGHWSILLPAMEAGGPYEIRVGDKTLSDVMVGDVWLCSGQSNVDVMISRVADLYREEVTTDSLPAVRLLKIRQEVDVTKIATDAPTDGWHVLEPKFAWDFSALSYFLAKRLYEKTGIPQGVIACSWGGTPIQSWIPADSSAWQPERARQLVLARDAAYQDSLRRANAAYSRSWNGLLFASDPGKRGNWQQTVLDDSQWTSVDTRQPIAPDSLAHDAQPAGSWWFRQHVTIDKKHAGRPALLRCGTLADADSVWLNGQFLGTTSYQYPPRRYPVPEGLLREGDNVVTVRITTGGQPPHFVHPKPYMLDFDGSGELLHAGLLAEGQTADVISLSPHWLMRRGAPMPSRRDAGFRLQDAPAACYQSLLAPLAELPISGVVWYQGESNTHEPQHYCRLLCSLMGSWRALWQRPDLPFYVVQLPEFNPNSDASMENAWASLREAQRQATLRMPHATLVVGLGLGEKVDIHPLRKREMAHRIAAKILGEDESRLWLKPTRPEKAAEIVCALKTPTAQIAVDELRGHISKWTAQRVELKKVKDKALGEEGYRITPMPDGSLVTLEATTDRGLLYAAYALLRKELCETELSSEESVPAYRYRILNHWDNMDGSIERGYAGKSFFWGNSESRNLTAASKNRWTEYARACASIGINVAVLNNVNASPQVLSKESIAHVRDIADQLRPYGLRVSLAINFNSPTVLGGLPTSDPLHKSVQQWWKEKVKEIYREIPDFAGFLVKANSEGQPGPQDFGRTQAEGANLLARALKPYGGLVMWRAFIYAPNDPDRAKQAYNEFKPLDGKFDPNVIIQVKNGPIDFQPYEPYNPLFGAMTETPVMPELQITMEYLGQERWLTFLAPMWQQFLRTNLKDCDFQKQGKTQSPKTSGPTLDIAQLTAGYPLSAIAGVANTGTDANWCGSLFNQANWYAFGRLAWNPELTPQTIAEEWTRQTIAPATRNIEDVSQWDEVKDKIIGLMTDSWETTTNAMMPLGLHHIFAGEHHYGPEPWWAPAGTRADWTPAYYHKADANGIGFDRTQATGSGATAQYPEPFARNVEDLATCPEHDLLWFHHLPWDYRMPNARTLWDNLCLRYESAYQKIHRYPERWNELRPYLDEQLHADVLSKLLQQDRDAATWHDACLLYFQSINRLPFPAEVTPPSDSLERIKTWTEQMRPTRK